MTADLYPTKTRLALLRDVAAELIYRWPGGRDRHDFSARTCTARITEMERAGWVWLDSHKMRWQLTDAGRAVLDAHPEATDDR